MRIERHKNFLSLEECSALNAWVDKGVQNKWFDFGVFKGSPVPERMTTRRSGDRFEYPQIVLDVSARIRAFCGVDSYEAIEDQGKNGIVVSCTFSGTGIHEHLDASSKTGLATLRCNVMTRAADIGGALHVGKQLVDIEAGELHCYLASEFEHYVSKVEGETPRILWMFGAHVPAKDWESGAIKVGAH